VSSDELALPAALFLALGSVGFFIDKQKGLGFWLAFWAAVNVWLAQ
jgi:hypothetical protein